MSKLSKKRRGFRCGLLGGAAAVTLALIALPVQTSGDGLLLEGAAALAKGKSEGGNGNGNGNGNGHNGTSAATDDDPGKSRGLGHDKQKLDAAADGEYVGQGDFAKALGRMNAFKASDQAKANALAKGSHSAVGQAALYEERMAYYTDPPADATDEDIQAAFDEAVEALAALANKPLDEDLVGYFNDELGLETSEQDDADLAEQAQEIQDEETNQGLGQYKD